ncbi:uroporphyrin-III C-methyltransferase, partial [Bacillus sp. D-CC]
LFTSATNKTSVMKQRLQEDGAEIYQIPTFKKEEYTLTLEQKTRRATLKSSLICSAESVEILMQSCNKYQKDIRSLQAELQHMNVATQDKL